MKNCLANLARKVALAMFSKGLGGLGEKLKAGVTENLGSDVLEAAKKLQANADEAAKKLQASGANALGKNIQATHSRNIFQHR